MSVQRHDLAPRITRHFTRTSFGSVRKRGNDMQIIGREEQLCDWTQRPGSVWPCATLPRVAHNLSDNRVVATLWKGDLVDIYPATAMIDGAELDAWMDDVLAEALGAES